MQLLQKLFLRSMQGLMLMVLIAPVIALFWQLIPTKDNPHPGENIVLDPDSEERELQQKPN